MKWTSGDLPSASIALVEPNDVPTEFETRSYRPESYDNSDGHLAAHMSLPYPVRSTDVFGRAAFPFASVCHLDMKFSTGPRVGTGFLVEDGFLVTAAHNLYDRRLREDVSAILATAGRLKSTAEPYPLYQYVSGRIPGDWVTARTDEESLNFDYALMRVRKLNIANQSPPIPLRHSLPPEKWNGGALGDLTITAHGVPDRYGNYMWASAGQTSAVHGNFVAHGIFTDEGWSGAPIVWSDLTDYCVLGIHSSATTLYGNVGVQFSRSVFLDLMRWRDELVAIA